MVKCDCELCGETVDTDDYGLDQDADGFIIKCPNECILFSIKFENLGDLQIHTRRGKK